MNQSEIDALIESLDLSPLLETQAAREYKVGFAVYPYSTINGEHPNGYDLTEGDAFYILSEALQGAGVAHKLTHDWYYGDVLVIL